MAFGHFIRREYEGRAMTLAFSVSDEEAEILAVRALGFLAEHRERMEGFIRMTGVAVGDLRNHASDRDYLGAVLDYLLADERCLLEFTERVGVEPELPYAARRKLEGDPASA